MENFRNHHYILVNVVIVLLSRVRASAYLFLGILRGDEGDDSSGVSRHSSMIRRRQPKAPLKAFDVADGRLVEGEVHFPHQRSVAEDPVAPSTSRVSLRSGHDDARRDSCAYRSLYSFFSRLLMNVNSLR